jgi:hypothetical protein
MTNILVKYHCETYVNHSEIGNPWPSFSIGITNYTRRKKWFRIRVLIFLCTKYISVFCIFTHVKSLLKMQLYIKLNVPFMFAYMNVPSFRKGGFILVGGMAVVALLRISLLWIILSSVENCPNTLQVFTFHLTWCRY